MDPQYKIKLTTAGRVGPNIIFLMGALILLMGTLIPFSGFSQTLERSTLLGIAPQQNNAGEPVRISRVLPRSTGSAIGLEVGDEIKKLNKQAIGDFSQLLRVIRNLKTGSPVEVEIVRNQKSVTLSGTMQPRPYETSTSATVHYDSVSYPGNHLRSIIYRPKNLKDNGKAPAIFFIQGYTCDSIDYGMIPNLTTRQLMEDFAKAGYVTYRVEKPGMGDSQSDKHCADITFTEESQAFIEGLKALKRLPYVDQDNTYIWGHALGVLHAPLVANEVDVAGIIGYGGVFKPWYDYLLDIYQVQSVLYFDTTPAQATRNTKRVQPFLDLWLNSDMPWHELLERKEVKPALNSSLLPVNGEQVFNRHYSFFRDLNQYDFAKLWQESKVPVLMIHGSQDIQAISPTWTSDIVNSNKHPKSRAKIIEGAEHAFMRYPNKAVHMQARSRGNYNPAEPGDKYDTRIAQATLEWLKTLND